MEIFESADTMSAADVLRVSPNDLRVIDTAAEVVDHAGAVEPLTLQFLPVVSAPVLAIVKPK